jgi:hypothetical protein
MPARKASKKTAAKKSTKTSVKATFPPPPINVQCLRACFDQHLACLKKGVDPALCMKRYIRCIEGCIARR